MKLKNQESIFTQIEKYYEDLINNEIRVDLRIGQARKIIDKIYNHFMDNPKIRDEFYHKIAEVKRENEKIRKENKYLKKRDTTMILFLVFLNF